MSFASETKIELCKEAPKRSCCEKAECYGLLLFGRSFSEKAIAFTTENAAAARRAAQLAAQAAGVITAVKTSGLRRRAAKPSYTVCVEGESQRMAALTRFGHGAGEVSLRLNRSNLENDCCPGAFLRGAFLCCGTVTNPEKDYRMEFSVPFHHLARDLAALLGELYGLALQPAISQRQGAFVVSVTSSEQVADLLTFMGAPNAAMQLMQVKMVKEVRNNVNRKTNFETANLDKTASAAARQILAIRHIEKSITIEGLPEDLQELARLRLQYPELSLRELGELLSEPLSRSGLNHRLRRLVEIAGRLPGGERAAKVKEK